jgi:tetratricopeptide (TPR) repeat protein
VPDIRIRLAAAMEADNWDEVLSWESRIDQLGLEEGYDREGIVFSREGIAQAYHNTGKFDKGGHLFLRCAEAWKALNRFSDEVMAISLAVKSFRKVGNGNTGIVLLERARDICREHGFVLVESKKCMELGNALCHGNRLDEAVEQHRRALAVVQNDASRAQHPGLPADSVEDRAYCERAALRELVYVLCKARQMEEADELFLLLREGGDGSADFLLWTHFLSGSLHEHRENYTEAAEAFQAAVQVAGKHRKVPGNSLDEHAMNALKRAEHGTRTFEIEKMVLEATLARDWPGVLRWEKDLEWMNDHFNMKHAFAEAHFAQRDYAKAACLYERCARDLEREQQFRDAAAALCVAGHCFYNQEDAQGGETLFQRARDLGAQHGFYSTECTACLGLGRVALLQGRTQEAEHLFRVALSAVDFIEDIPNFPSTLLAKDVNIDLAMLLLTTDRFEDAGPSVQNLLDLSEAEPDPKNAVHFEARILALEFHSIRGDIKQADKKEVLP